MLFYISGLNSSVCLLLDYFCFALVRFIELYESCYYSVLFCPYPHNVRLRYCTSLQDVRKISLKTFFIMIYKVDV